MHANRTSRETNTLDARIGLAMFAACFAVIFALAVIYLPA